MDVTGPRIAIRPVCGLPLLHVDEPALSGGRRIAKGCVDRIASAVGLLILLPLLVAIASPYESQARVRHSSGRRVSGFMVASSPCSNSEQ